MKFPKKENIKIINPIIATQHEGYDTEMVEKVSEKKEKEKLEYTLDIGKHRQNTMVKTVVIGGGSGIFPVLRGLKKRANQHVTAIVSVFDSGGSTGLLREEFGVWALGDLRRCLIALSHGKNSKMYEELLEHRFEKNSSLNGHNFGNLFLLALSEIIGNGPESIIRASKLLHVKGNVVPVSLERANVCAVLQDGTVIVGETNIDIPKHNGDLKIKRAFLKPSVKLYEGARRAILGADIVIIGPGDLYTSLIPNLLVDGMSEALRLSTAKKIYMTNMMTKWGETHCFSASDFAKEILSYSGLEQFDYIISNKKIIGDIARKRYAKEKKYPVRIDEHLGDYAKHVILSDLFRDEDIVRHDYERVARIIHSISKDMQAHRAAMGEFVRSGQPYPHTSLLSESGS